jgi:hypothetical protein
MCAGWANIFHQFQSSMLWEMRTMAIFLLVQFLVGGYINHLHCVILYQGYVQNLTFIIRQRKGGSFLK